jgi:hypothetical protein
MQTCPSLKSVPETVCTVVASKLADKIACSDGNCRRHFHSIPLLLAVHFLLGASVDSLADCALRGLCISGRTSPSNAPRPVEYC